ncbi:ROK family protein [Flavobacterium sp. JAS]|uniref:ROK family protein n=1 Tax=Flavobacterium sp. JAS TaxID=2897329 RepID=UPI001E503545|nr:ROK family protein [Flavobacterium sp. JAS]MCD0472341.1 ROK family protein [Flavobacterium sp. JAS]
MKNSSIGVDIGGTIIKYGLIDTSGKLIWASNKPTNAKTSKKKVINNILEIIRDCIGIADSLKLNILSIGVGSPGLINNNNVILGGAENIKDWNNIPLGEIIFNRFGILTKVCNDADAMAMGEYELSFKDNETNIYITLGTGIGGAIFINGNLFQGHNGLGGELGVIPIIIGNQHYYWEDLASTTGLVKLYKSKLGITDLSLEINGKYIANEYNKGNIIALETVNIFTEYIAMGLAGYVNIFNPKRIIIGGGITESNIDFLEKIRTHIKKYAIKECLEGVEIVLATLGNNAGLIGAALNSLKYTETKKT